MYHGYVLFTIRRDHSLKILPKGDRLTHEEFLPGGSEMIMSSKSRREYLNTMRQRYKATSSRSEKSEIINVLCKNFNSGQQYQVSTPYP